MSAAPGQRSNAWYLYGLTAGGPPERVVAIPGVMGSLTQAVIEDGLIAVVSPLESLDGWGLEGVSEPLELLAPRLFEHERVLRRLVAQAGVLPFRFGTVYPSTEAVRSSLARAHAQAEAAWRRLGRAVEWHVAVSWERQKAMSCLGSGGDEARAPAPGGLDGRGYLAQQSRHRKLDLSLGHLRGQAVAGLRASLLQVAQGCVGLKPRQQERSPAGVREELGRAAYLVERSQANLFRAALADGLESQTELGLGAELSGPWPPYNFSRLELGKAA